jgi:hypothetical protein
MKGNSTTSIATIVMILLMLIGAGMWMGIATSKEENDTLINAFVLYGGWLVILGFIAAIFSFVYSVVVNPDQIRGVLIGIAVVVVVGGLSYILADGSDYASYKVVIDEQTSKMVSTGLNAFYIVGFLAVASVIYSGVSRILK